MTEVEAVTRKWGNSLGITIPKEVIEKEHISENQRIRVDIKPSGDIRRIRGLGVFKKTTQQLKDEMRTGWE